MKTLHKIFHKNLFKSYSIILLTSIVATFIYFSITKYQNSSIYFNILKFSLWGLSFLLPLTTLFINNNFGYNARWFINQNYSRKTLLKFHFVSQSLKLLLFLINSFLIFFVYYLQAPASELKTYGFSFTTSDIQGISFIILCTLFPIYGATLFPANRQQMYRINFQQKNSTKRKIIIAFLVVGFFLFVTVMEKLQGIPATFIYAPLLGFIFTSFFIILNRTFSLFEETRKFKVAQIIFISVALIFSLFIIPLRHDVLNAHLKIEDRVTSYIELEWMAPQISNETKLAFLNSKKRYKDLLKKFKNQFPYTELLKTANNKRKAQIFMDCFSKQIEEQELKETIAYMRNIKDQYHLDIMFDRYMYSLLIEQKKCSDVYINQLLTNKDSFSQYSGIVLKRAKLSDKEFPLFIKSIYKSLLPEVQRIYFIYEAMYSSEKKH